MDYKGTESAADFILDEADCSDGSVEVEVCEESLSEVSDLIDNSVCEEGNSAELFAQQQAFDCETHIEALKRKLKIKPRRKPFQDLSSRLNHPAKRKPLDDSGYAEDFAGEVVQVDKTNCPSGSEGYGSFPSQASNKENVENYTKLLKESNVKAAKLATFKSLFTISFTALIRVFKSDKTCCRHWVVVCFGAREELLESSKVLLQKQCEYIFLSYRSCKYGFLSLHLLEFKAAKSRETVRNLFCNLLNCDKDELLIDPPKLRSLPAATFWWKKGFAADVFSWGELPDFIAQQTSITHQQAEQQPFSLSSMVQWAYDHEYLDEAQIAYQYARLANEDYNAAAFLNCNNQVKHVKECAQMVKYYKTAEMRDMSMGQWIKKCQDKVEGDGDWKEIVKFLKFQGINMLSFLAAMKDFLQGVPKKNCIVIFGPPNTGKSMFVMSFMKFMHGKVISFVNSRSHFWLQPLAYAKLAVLDDATSQTWLYFDQYLRNGLDGNPVSLDCKHRAPTQINFPPLMMTTNIDVKKDPTYLYLHSRIVTFEFPNTFPFDNKGEPAFVLNELSWKSFFGRLWKQLDLGDPDAENQDGGARSPFRCCTRAADADI
ncbi:E1 protein [Bos taurus papillomavirus 20]|uniref:Replication protein E1 n=1 Tax=Bos taurus papillomavirus 20 TaxID=1887218 RepID=A0A1B2K224_9PAPI|nr:E1 protein [Bos taurus papillomavirus 20]ANZ90259.1 E1 protein [Bos taurus papillomavirus 20]